MHMNTYITVDTDHMLQSKVSRWNSLTNMLQLAVDMLLLLYLYAIFRCDPSFSVTIFSFRQFMWQCYALHCFLVNGFAAARSAQIQAAFGNRN